MSLYAFLSSLTDQGGQSMTTSTNDIYLTIAEAAKLVKVHKSTIQRLIARGQLPAYRVSERGVRVKQVELERALTPASKTVEKGGVGMHIVERALDRPRTAQQRRQALAALDGARKLRDAILAKRGGVPFEDSSELIREMREERSRELADL